MCDERWAPIAGHSNYSISSQGRVRRDARGRGSVVGRVLTGKKTKKGYLIVDLSVDDVKTRRLIHQLVAEAFLPPRPSVEHFPNHLDADKTNNNVENLEWATRAENNAHARRLGLVPSLRGEANGRSKLTAVQVDEIRAVRGHQSQRAIAARFSVARSLVQRIHQGRAWVDMAEWPADVRVREMPRGEP